MANPAHFKRDNILEHHRKAVEASIVQEMRNKGTQYESLAPATEIPSTPPQSLEKMKQISYSELALCTSKNLNLGRFFKGKIIEPTFKMSSIMTILEDIGSREVVQIAIYNYKLTKSLKEEFKIGKIMIIKNPFYKIYADGWPGIRVDDPSTISFEDPPNPKTLLSTSSSSSSSQPSTSPNSSSLQLPKWQIISPEFKMYKRALHSGFAVDNQTLVYWGGVSPESDAIIRCTVPTAELVMFDTQGMNSFYSVVQGELPTPGFRNGHVFISDYEGKYAYLLGGSPSDGAFSLNIVTVEWKKLKQIKYDYSNACAAAVPGYIYIFGGRSSVGAAPSNEMYRLQTNTYALEKVIPKGNQVPKGRSSACLATVMGRFLVLYGGDGSLAACCDDLWIFDTQKLTWHNIVVSGLKPVGLGLSGWAKYIHPDTKKDVALLFYGGLTISGTMKNDLWLLDITTLKWEIVPSASKNMKPLSHHTNLIAGNKLYIYGGTDTVGPVPNIINTMYCLDISHAVKDKDSHNCSWTCLYCGSYTLNKCTKCGMVQFCNLKCQESCLDHMADCDKFCGKDEVSKSLKIEKEYLEKLMKLNEEKNQIISENQKRIEDMESMFRKMNKSIHEKEELIKYTMNQEQNLISEINQKTNEIQQYETTFNAIIEQTDSQREEFQKQIKQLTQERAILSEAHGKTKSNVANLQQQVAHLKSSLQQTELLSSQKVTLLNAEIEKNQAEIKQQKELFENVKVELTNLKKQIEELNEASDCPICFENKRDHVLQPCGHVFCFECIPKPNSNCPICRQLVKSSVKMFWN